MMYVRERAVALSYDITAPTGLEEYDVREGQVLPSLMMLSPHGVGVRRAGPGVVM